MQKRGLGGSGRGVLSTLDRVGRRLLKETCKARFEGPESSNHVYNLGKSIPGRGNSQCKGPMVATEMQGGQYGCSRVSKVGEEWWTRS